MQKFLKVILGFFTIEPARKILALILAFGLWLFVAIDNTYNYEMEIPVIYVNLPDRYTIVDSVAKLRVLFSGKGRNLINIWATPPRAICSLEEVVPGKNVIATKDLQIEVKDVTVNFYAKFINIEIDDKITKIVRPVIPIKGSPKDGFAISHIDVPDTILATGAKRFLQKLSRVLTESLDVKNQTTSFEKILKIESLPECIKLSRKDLKVKVFIDSLSQKAFTDLPILIIKNPGQRVRISSSTIDSLVITGAKSRLDELQKEKILVQIKVGDLVPGDYYLVPEIILPDFLSPVYTMPQRLQVQVY
jgi:YbbR domain-containing protein|uniref:YbbR-like domain-containing protein n=1 Tax=candidate division WOR-3 bacterium TaxID=2052148 RepID=A0A7V3RGD2_UNCW3